ATGRQPGIRSQSTNCPISRRNRTRRRFRSRSRKTTSTTTTANSPIGHGRQSISKLLRKNEEEMSPKVTGGATVGPQDHEAKDDLAPPAAREGSPLGGV